MTQAVQTAVFSALNVSAVTSLLSQAHGGPAIYAEPAPQAHEAEAENMFPYITLSIPSAPLLTDKGATGIRALVQVDCWARGSSWAAVEAVASAAFARLHRQEIALADLICVEGVTRDRFIDPDGRTLRVMLQFRVMALPDA